VKALLEPVGPLDVTQVDPVEASHWRRPITSGLWAAYAAGRRESGGERSVARHNRSTEPNALPVLEAVAVRPVCRPWPASCAAALAESVGGSARERPVFFFFDLGPARRRRRRWRSRCRLCPRDRCRRRHRITLNRGDSAATGAVVHRGEARSSLVAPIKRGESPRVVLHLLEVDAVPLKPLPSLRRTTTRVAGCPCRTRCDSAS